uniref:SH2 domain-containing protein n=1 Tax=Panagrolaimus sp. JU765 TaxID=591449 RepID=A0AC34QMG1_9BILA
MPQQEKRRKRPVSVILGQAINNVSAQTDNTLTPKKVSTRPQQFGTPAIMLCDGAVDRKPSQIPVNKEPALEFDEKLGEFVFPIGEFMDDQLQRLAYFCKNQNREEVYPVLQQMPEGAFILRYSASRRKCLALTVRIPENENGSKIAHFLIIRNEHGFRIKGAERYFKSLPMLITHYTILPELLPCRLIFVEWDKTLLKGKPQQNTLICLDNCAKDYQTMNIIELNQSPRRKLARKSIQLCQI